MIVAFAPFKIVYTPEPISCSSTGAKSGTRILQDWICDESPWADDFIDLGIFACRDVFGDWCPDCDYDNLSSHASGRAGDSGTVSKEAGDALAAFLVANHAVLGIQEVIWYRRRWTNQTLEWRDYDGLSPHTDHVHWAQNLAGALYLTRDRLLSVIPGAPTPTPPQEALPVYKIAWIKSGTKPGKSYRVLYAEGKDHKMVPVEAFVIDGEVSLERWRKRLEEVPSSQPLTANTFTVVWDGPYANV